MSELNKNSESMKTESKKELIDKLGGTSGSANLKKIIDEINNEMNDEKMGKSKNIMNRMSTAMDTYVVNDKRVNVIGEAIKTLESEDANAFLKIMISLGLSEEEKISRSEQIRKIMTDKENPHKKEAIKSMFDNFINKGKQPKKNIK